MRREEGFTLVELLVALTVAALLLTAVYRTVTASMAARAQAEAGNAVHHRARLLADRLGRELLSLQLPPDAAEAGLVVDDRNGVARLAFSSHASTPLAGMPGVPARISYSLRPAGAGEAGPLVLQRSESSVLNLAAPAARRFIDGVRRVQWRCLVDGVWQERFAPTPERPLPQAVSVLLETADGTSFRTAFAVGGGG